MPDKTKCMASKAAVDLHDHLKRDMMTLFSLEKVLQKKAGSMCHVPSHHYRSNRAGCRKFPSLYHCNLCTLKMTFSYSTCFSSGFVFFVFRSQRLTG